MAFTDFLAEGTKIPEGSALKASTSQTILPAWYTNYAMDLLSGQQALSAQPYATYQAPRVANFTPDQQSGFDLTKQAAGAYAPALGAAMTMTAGAANPGGMTAAQPFFNRAASLDAVGAAQPHMTGALNALGQSTQTSGLNAAMPYIDMSARSSADPRAYMDPYMDAVVNRVGDLGARTLREKLLPEIEGRFIGAGQWGGSGQMLDNARALRDVHEAVLAEQGNLLSSGYRSAQGALSSDLARYGSLGSTVGNLATTEQGNLLRAGEAQANIGQTMGQLTQGQQNILANLGTSAGNIAGADASGALSAAAQLGTLGGLAQKYGLEGAGAVTGIGDAQQKLNQQNLDIAYADFLRQQGYSQEQINNMLSTFKGVAPGVPSGTQEQGIVPVGDGSTYKPGTAATIVGALTGAAGIAKDLGLF